MDKSDIVATLIVVLICLPLLFVMEFLMSYMTVYVYIMFVSPQINIYDLTWAGIWEIVMNNLLIHIWMWIAVIAGFIMKNN